MKPDWKDAPEWANWVAMDFDGTWYWYEKQPYKCTCFDGWNYEYESRWEHVVNKDTSWDKSLQQRPKEV